MLLPVHIRMLTISVSSSYAPRPRAPQVLPNNKAIQAHRTRVFDENKRGETASAAADAQKERDILARYTLWKQHHLYRLTVSTAVFATTVIAALNA